MLRIVGIEPRGHSQCQNLSGARVLHHHSAVQSLYLSHLLIQGAFRHILDVRVDGQLHALARQRITLFRIQYMPLGINGRQNMPWLPMKFAVEFSLESAESIIVSTYIAENG